MSTTFQLGVNLPWLHYGGDFGANAWRPDGGVHRPDARAALDEVLARLADRGVRLVRWFTLCDGRAGVDVTESGAPRRLDASARRDLDAALAALDRAGLQAMFVLLDFLIASPRQVVNGVAVGGRASWLSSADHRARLVHEVVGPFVSHARGAPAVHSWDLLNEPEWMTFGAGAWRPGRAITRGQLRAFVAECLGVLREATHAPATVGLAGTGGLGLVRGLGLDFYQVHWYDHVDGPAALTRPVASLELDAPVWLGEFPTASASRSAAEIVRAARAAGYAGALAWSYTSQDRFSSADACAACAGDASG